jgi:hypothetical protein
MLHLFIRAVLSFITWIAVSFFSFWMFFAQIFPLGIAPIFTFLFASAAALFVWRKSGNLNGGGLAAHIVMGAVILGAIGFIGGFFGPLIFAPDANQGPLLGLFITGPLGFIGGGVAGGIWWLARRKDAAR